MTIAPRSSSSSGGSSKSKRQHRTTSLPLLPEEVVGEILALYDCHQHWLRFRSAMCELEMNAFEMRAGQFSDHDGVVYPSLIREVMRFDDRRASAIRLAGEAAKRAEHVRAGCEHGNAYTLVGHQGVVLDLQRLAPTLCDAIPFPVNDYLPRPLWGRPLTQLAQVWRGTCEADLYWEMYDEHDYVCAKNNRLPREAWSLNKEIFAWVRDHCSCSARLSGKDTPTSAMESILKRGSVVKVTVEEDFGEEPVCLPGTLRDLHILNDFDGLLDIPQGLRRLHLSRDDDDHVSSRTPAQLAELMVSMPTSLTSIIFHDDPVDLGNLEWSEDEDEDEDGGFVETAIPWPAGVEELELRNVDAPLTLPPTLQSLALIFDKHRDFNNCAEEFHLPSNCRLSCARCGWAATAGVRPACTRCRSTWQQSSLTSRTRRSCTWSALPSGGGANIRTLVKARGCTGVKARAASTRRLRRLLLSQQSFEALALLQSLRLACCSTRCNPLFSKQHPDVYSSISLLQLHLTLLAAVARQYAPGSTIAQRERMQLLGHCRHNPTEGLRVLLRCAHDCSLNAPSVCVM
ncbi:hypothetical protein JKP88DRAFT_250725 [Tribonema minus]|uniref:Uncharacterized protein n=1 Tax=Tribonema minus TaxID=303371 RepID=A0A835ZDR5_9STRA|nr:hypothetical protein JKP88DRAFT_250725 [Tribonema minus]